MISIFRFPTWMRSAPSAISTAAVIGLLATAAARGEVQPSSTSPWAPTFTLQQVLLQGASAYKPEILHAFYDPLLARPATEADITRMVSALTDYYRKGGYFLASVSVPKQRLDYGVLVVRVTEGTLTGIRIEGDRRLYSDSMKRIAERLIAMRPVTQPAFEQAVRSIGSAPGVAVNATVAPSTRGEGQYDLVLNLSRAQSPVIEASAARAKPFPTPSIEAQAVAPKAAEVKTAEAKPSEPKLVEIPRTNAEPQLESASRSVTEKRDAVAEASAAQSKTKVEPRPAEKTASAPRVQESMMDRREAVAETHQLAGERRAPAPKKEQGASEAPRAVADVHHAPAKTAPPIADVAAAFQPNRQAAPAAIAGANQSEAAPSTVAAISLDPSVPAPDLLLRRPTQNDDDGEHASLSERVANKISNLMYPFYFPRGTGRESAFALLDHGVGWYKRSEDQSRMPTALGLRLRNDQTRVGVEAGIPFDDRVDPTRRREDRNGQEVQALFMINRRF